MFELNNILTYANANIQIIGIFIAIIGGSIGSIIGMYQFRHKTKHRQFTTGLPFIIFIQIMILIYYT